MAFFEKIKSGLQKTRENVMNQVNNVLKSFAKIDEELFDELEEVLIMADIGVKTTDLIISSLRNKIRENAVKDTGEVRSLLKDIILKMMIEEDKGLKLSTTPSVVLLIGVNGAGKTTTIAKLAAMLKREGRKVLLCAADTFRAGAIDQLEVWAERAEVDIVKHSEGSDPAAVVHDSILAGQSRGADVILIDTAGRLQNKKNLMDELNKIFRVVDKGLSACDKEILLVLDATMGQNAINQAKEFMSVAHATGVVLTKLDGTAKGGIVIAVKQEIGLPVRYIGIGEKMDDLQPFDPVEFVEALFE